MIRVAWRHRHRVARQALGSLHVAEARETVGVRRGDLVVLWLEPVRDVQMTCRVRGQVHRHVQEVTEVVVVPRRTRRRADRSPIGRDGHLVVSEERLTQPHERVGDVVSRARGHDLAQVERRLPGMPLEP